GTAGVSGDSEPSPVAALSEDRTTSSVDTPSKPLGDVLSVPSLIALVEPATVRIDVDLDDDTKAIGSGFIISEEGVAVTNYHVIDGAHGATATFENGAVVKIVGTLLVEPATDIAIVKLVAPGQLPFLTL